MESKAQHNSSEHGRYVRIDDFELTMADKQAWWEFIEHYHPDYYEWAKFYYSGEHDPDLEPDYVPQDMDINDYLVEFKGLPRISTDTYRHTIMVNGVDKAKYLDHDSWYKKRLTFARLKRTPAFRSWKDEQFKAQYGRCAWCRKPLDLHSEDTHVDHIIPLLWWGNNTFNNLVLSCADCNMEKSARVSGYHGAKGALGENQKPTWIRPNRYTNYFDSHLEIIKDQVAKIKPEDVEIKTKRNNWSPTAF